MNSKRVLFLTPVFLIVALSIQSCDLSSALLSPGTQTKLSFSSLNSNPLHSGSSQPPEDSLKPCGGSLAPGESCTLSVQFTPSAVGSRTGSMQIRSNGEVLEQVALSGQGQ